MKFSSQRRDRLLFLPTNMASVTSDTNQELHQEPDIVQIATLLTVIEEPKIEIFSWRLRLESFAAYCLPLKNVPFERYKFYSRMQEGVVKKAWEKLMREIPGNINLWEIQKTALKGNSTHSTEGPIHQVTKLPSAPGPRFTRSLEKKHWWWWWSWWWWWW